jgi:hypothetical protein
VERRHGTCDLQQVFQGKWGNGSLYRSGSWLEIQIKCTKLAATDGMGCYQEKIELKNCQYYKKRSQMIMYQEISKDQSSENGVYQRDSYCSNSAKKDPISIF